MVLGLEYLENTILLGGMVVIVALSFDHMLNHAGIPAFVNRIPVMLGAFTVSAVSMRLVFAVASSTGVQLLNWGDMQGWIYNNKENTQLVNSFLADNPALCIGLILFTFAASMVLGGLGGWLLARVAIGLSPALMLMVTLSLTDLGCIFGRNVTWLSAGTLGLFVPDFLAFAPGYQGILLMGITAAIVAVIYLLLDRLEASPWGRLVAAVADNPVAAASLGKDILSLRGQVVFFTSGLMALAGVMWSFYSLFVVESSFHNGLWLFWPMMAAVLIGGSGHRWRIILGTGVFYSIYLLIISFKFELQYIFPFPVSYAQDLLLSIVILLALTRLPRIMARRRIINMRGIRYDEVVTDTS
jgi:branched-chain amino acid transport system permease protein